MAAAAAGVGRLEEEALRRKERLKALREKTGRKTLLEYMPLTRIEPGTLQSAGRRSIHRAKPARAGPRFACWMLPSWVSGACDRFRGGLV
uniref:Coiled-coil domain containing 12 n=1 Tax=Myotis myotis TaxID=51298 RepID=A0A7J7UBK1_MYOMY|nr:coiled-coil domain containing 12 [Myotis myotis]